MSEAETIKWQPIRTAPMDETLVWLFEPHAAGGFMFAGLFDVKRQAWINNLDQQAQKPSHWMPLPNEPRNAMERVEAAYLVQVAEIRAKAQPSPRLQTTSKRPFFPRVSRLDPERYNGDRWAIDGRFSERYTAKTWRMVMHVLHATVFG